MEVKLPAQQSPSSNATMATAGFTKPELHYLVQGLAKIIAESRQHSLALANSPANSVDDTTVGILNYYENRIGYCTQLINRLEQMQAEIVRKDQYSVAHNTFSQA